MLHSLKFFRKNKKNIIASTHVTYLRYNPNTKNVKRSNIVDVINFLFKRGLKYKSITLSNMFFTNALNSDSYINRSVLKYVFRDDKITLLNKSVDRNISFGGFSLIIRTIQSNRKIIKYSKGKLRYRGYLYNLRKRQEVGFFLKLWKVENLYGDFKTSGNSYPLLTLSFFSNFFEEGLDSPHVIQKMMLKKYVDNIRSK